LKILNIIILTSLSSSSTRISNLSVLGQEVLGAPRLEGACAFSFNIAEV
jgi:hypothetical protein